MSRFELIINDANTLHHTTEEAKLAAFLEQVHRWGQEQPIEWYQTEHGWEGFNDLGFYLIKEVGSPVTDLEG
jgi:hypothetical protein